MSNPELLQTLQLLSFFLPIAVAVIMRRHARRDVAVLAATFVAVVALQHPMPVFGYTVVGLARAIGSRSLAPLHLGRLRLRSFGIGLVLGACMFLTFIASTLVLGDARMQLGDGIGTFLIPPLLSLTLLALWEELVFRCMVLGTLKSVVSMPLAIAISSVFFMFSHALNGLSAMYVIALMSAGLLLSCARLLDHGVGLAWGLHFAWNYLQYAVFGYEQGPKDPRVIDYVVTQHTLWSGTGSEEDGLGTIVITLLACVALTLWKRGWWRNELDPPTQELTPAPVAA